MCSGDMMEEPTSRDRDTAAGRGKLQWAEPHWSALSAIKDAGELACVVRADQRRRWRSGQRVVIDFYFEDFPALGATESVAADLVFHEFCLREEFGPPPTFDEFRERFPPGPRPTCACSCTNAGQPRRPPSSASTPQTASTAMMNFRHHATSSASFRRRRIGVVYLAAGTTPTASSL